jgi:hypothetical protein
MLTLRMRYVVATRDPFNADFMDSGQDPLAGSCERGNELSGSVNGGELTS